MKLSLSNRIIKGVVVLFFVLLALLAVPAFALAQTPPTTPETATPESVGTPIPKIHIVQDGETLTSIALFYGVTVEQLQQANNITDPSFIYLGQELVIPNLTGEPLGTTYTIQLGDTLAGIAAAFNNMPDEIAHQNRLLHPGYLIVGESLLATSRTGSTASAPLTGKPYLVETGDSLLLVAAKTNLSPMQLASFNGLPYPAQLYPGQRLRLPGDQPYQFLSGEWGRITLSPIPAAQGRTLWLYVETLQPGEITGNFGEQPIRFGRAGNGYLAFIGLSAFIEPGLHQLELSGTSDHPWLPLRQMVMVEDVEYGAQTLTLPPEKSDVLDPEKRRLENEYLTSFYTQFTPQQQWSGLFQMPITMTTDVQLTAGYGGARSYNGGPFESFHTGTDFATYAGTPVLAPNDGTVILSQEMFVRGNLIIVDHGLGVMSAFFHLSKSLVQPGDRVVMGQIIGEVGSTGLSTGPHLHWDLRIMDVPVDALQWTETVFDLSES